MHFLKFLVSLSLTILFIWSLGRSWTIPNSPQTITNEKGEEVELPASETFLPPIGKLLSPSHGFWQNAEGDLPPLRKAISSEKLSATVEVQYDDRMVPHIFAASLEDAAFAQGYVTAALRLWQMELQTHAAAGRLTEVFGTTTQRREALIPRDKHTRRIGMTLAAERAIEEWKKLPEYEYIEAYADGINAYINDLSYADYPLMYKLQNYAPEPWTTLKSALLLKSMGRTLTDKNHDFEKTNVLKHLGLEKYAEIFPDYFPQQSPIILDSLNHIQPLAIKQDSISYYLGDISTIDSTKKDETPKGIGSNNWAVAPSKTANGNAILCNDPHLTLNLPSIWFEVQLHTPDFNTYGASLPGAPGVISGFNEHIAWGVTNVSHDVKDWYAIEWKDEKKEAYLFDGGYKKVEKRIEEIKVRGQASVFDTILITHIGPIAHSSDGQDFALRWTLHDPSEEVLTFVKLMRGRNYKDYLDAIQHFACPAQNLVFASKKGNIALWTQGKLPLRQENQGKFVQWGNRSEELWQGFIPQSDIPHEHNPAKGFVASANQHSVDPNLYPYPFYGYFEDYRGRYLNRRLTQMDSITIEDMMALQQDAYSVKAEDFMGILKEHLQTGKLSKNELEVWHKLEKWDYFYGKDKIEPTIFECWFDTLFEVTYDELLALEKDKNMIGDVSVAFPEEYQLFHLLKNDTANAAIDIQATPQRERIADLITVTFQQICDDLPKNKEGQILAWKFKRGTVINHLARVAPFGVDSIETNGHPSTLNALGKTPGPSWRMIVELGADKINAFGVYPGGQSENPGSRFYDKMIEKWAKGEYYPLLFLADKKSENDKVLFKQKLYKLK